jgi:hypothetical protein
VISTPSGRVRWDKALPHVSNQVASRADQSILRVNSHLLRSVARISREEFQNPVRANFTAAWASLLSRNPKVPNPSNLAAIRRGS